MTAPPATATTLMTPETNANPYPEYDRLRAQSPISFGQEAGSSAAPPVRQRGTGVVLGYTTLPVALTEA